MIKNLSKTEIEDVLSNHYIGRVGCCKDNVPHVIPITYFYDKESGDIISHTREGMKIDIFRNNPTVCLEVEEVEDLQNWKSVVVYGEFEELKGITARKVLHTFVENVRDKINSRQEKKVTYLGDISHSTHPENQGVIYRIRPTKIKGKFEKQYLLAH